MNRIHPPARAKAYFEDKLAFTTGPVELEKWIKSHEDNLVVVDVREEEDYAKGHIPGAINLPKNKWDSLRGLAKNKTNVVYCYSQQCHLAANACARFAGSGPLTNNFARLCPSTKSIAKYCTPSWTPTS